MVKPTNPESTERIATAAAWLLANVVAVVALVQPYLYWLWKKYFRRGRIEVHEATKIEVGFSGFGPTLGLLGTLRAVHEDQFVRSVELVVTRDRDSLCRKLEWLALRPASVVLGAPAQTSLELASGFMLLTSQPFKYNIFFTDPQFQTRLATVVDALRGHWFNFLLAATGGDAPQEVSEVYGRFVQERTHVDAYTEIDRMFDWQPETYTAEMRVNTANPDRRFHRVFHFSLTEEQIALLRLNALTVLREVCGQPVDGLYNFAYCGYIPDARDEERRTAGE